MPETNADPLVDQLAALICDGCDPGPCYDSISAAGRTLKFLANAGRLLPEGGETEAHWRSRYLATGNAYEMRGLRRSTRQEVESDVMHDRALGYDVVMESRTVRYWPDATTFTGPWVAVDQEATDAE